MSSIFFERADILALISSIAPYVHVDDYESVTNILFRATRAQKSDQRPKESPNLLPYNAGECWRGLVHTCKPGMVYLMQCGDLVKIGKTRTSLEQRATAITNQLKMPALPFFALETPCCSGVECHLHHKFCDRRISGEFFRLDDFDIAYVKSLAYWNDLPIRAYDVARDAYFWPSPKWRKPLQLSPGAPTVPDMAIQLQERFRAIIEAAQLLKDGPTVAELRDRAGHANISTTSLYAHVSGEKATATRLKIQ